MRSRDFYRRKAGRRDSNHASIRDGLRKLGHLVVDLAGVGGGVHDLLVFPNFGWSCATAVFVELKTEAGKANLAQLDFMAQLASRGIRSGVARTLNEAVALLRFSVDGPATGGAARPGGDAGPQPPDARWTGPARTQASPPAALPRLHRPRREGAAVTPADSRAWLDRKPPPGQCGCCDYDHVKGERTPFEDPTPEIP